VRGTRVTSARARPSRRAGVSSPSAARLGIQPGKPEQNACIERFNRRIGRGCLDADLFEVPAEVQQVTDEWLIDYNEQRPHDALGRVPRRASIHGRSQPRPSPGMRCVLDGGGLHSDGRQIGSYLRPAFAAAWAPTADCTS
jgi:transposase InsO family protein